MHRPPKSPNQDGQKKHFRTDTPMQFFRWSLHTCFKNQTVNITFESELPTELTDFNQYSLMLTCFTGIYKPIICFTNKHPLLMLSKKKKCNL